MVSISVKAIRSFYGEERFASLHQAYIDSIVEKKEFFPIIITSDFYIVDGHHRFAAARKMGLDNIKVIILAMRFKDTLPLRDLDRKIKHIVQNYLNADWSVCDEYKRMLISNEVLLKENFIDSLKKIEYYFDQKINQEKE